MAQRARQWRGAIVAVAALLLLVGAAGIARGHAELREAEPEVGATFRWGRPERVHLRFTQALQEASIVVTNRQFEPFQQGEAQLLADDPRAASVALPPLPPGTYTVSWRVLSVDDHPLEGAYDFTVLPRAPVVTLAVVGVVLPLFALFVFSRRERAPSDP